MSVENKLIVTIVTVCYNAEKEIRKTLESVLNQTMTSFEYIVKDGKSTDGTNKIICEFAEKFIARGIPFRHIVSDDDGIYDAMNIATHEAKGKYVNYLNVGDIFYNEHVLENVFSIPRYACIVYGDSICEYEFKRGKTEYTYWTGRHDLLNQMPFSHQACFFLVSKVKEILYDTKYKSAADYKLILDLCKVEEPVHYPAAVSICTMNGVSNKNIKRSYLETLDIQNKSGIIGLKVKNIFIKRVIISIKQIIIDVFPSKMLGNILRYNLIRKHQIIYNSIEEISKKI